MGTRALSTQGASDDPDGREPAGGLLVSVLAHAAVATVLVLLSVNRIGINTAPPATPLFLGFLGPNHFATNLEVPQENALRFHIYQRGQAGRDRAISANLVTPDPKPAVDKSRPRRDDVTPSRDGVLPSSLRQRSAARPSNENGTEADATDEAAAIAALEPEIALSENFAITHLVKPVYPVWELDNGVRARVLVTIRVSRQGEVEDARVASAETTPPGSSTAFELTAVEALLQWRFLLPRTPEYEAGCILTVPVEYEPTDKNFQQLGQQVDP